MKDIEIQCFSEWTIEYADDAAELTVRLMDDGRYLIKVPKWANFSVPQLFHKGDRVTVEGKLGIIKGTGSSAYVVLMDDGSTKYVFTTDIDKVTEE